MSYTISDAADTILVADTFNTAYSKRDRPQSLLFHSDKGVQYTSEAFCGMLKDYGVKQSFSKTAYPYDNAVVESFFSSLKREEDIRYQEYDSFEELKASIDEYIHHYNYERPHQSLEYKTPNMLEQAYSA